MVIGLFPELLVPGGIQRVGQQVGACLAAFASRRGVPCRFLSLNDPPGLHRLRVAGTEFSASGFRRAKLRFLISALRAARGRPLLVAAMHSHLAPVACAARVRAPHLRVLVFTHGIEVWTPLSPHRRWALRSADLVLAPSAHTARQLAVVQGVPEQKIRQLPWALDPQFAAHLAESFEDASSNHLPAGFPKGSVVLTVGRWSANEQYKGVDHLIACLPRLLPTMPDLFLAAIGEGDDCSRLERLAAEHGVAERVRFFSGLTQAELMAAYARCDVFALPSRGEGFGMVFLEAMAHGKPAIGGAHGGIPEILEDGVTGLLVSHGDLDQLTRALATLLADEPLRRQMGNQARERVRSAFLYEQFAVRLENILDSLCAS